MVKKFIPLAASAAALLAFAAPAAHATGPLITNSLGETANAIEATSTNTRTETVAGTLECTTAKLQGTITTNADTTAKVHGTGTMTGTAKATPPTHTGHCGTSSGAVTEYTNVLLTDLHLTKHGAETTGTTSFSITYDIRSATGAGLIAECTWGGVVPVKKTGTSAINVEGKITKTGGGAFCPGEGTLKGDFTVNADGFGPATIH